MIEAAERAGALEAGRHSGRGDRRQHRPRPGAGGRAQGLPAGAGHPRQDEPGEDLPPARARCRGPHDPLRRRQGPPRVLPGHGRADRPRDAAATTSTSSRNPANPAGARDDDRPRDLGADGRARSTRWCAASARAAPSPASVATSRAWRPRWRWSWPIRPARCWRTTCGPGSSAQAGSWLVEGIGEDFMPPIADLSRVRRAYTIPDEESLPTARALLRRRGHPGRLVVGHAGRRGPALLPRADDAEARRDVRLRQRQQVPVEDVQRLLDARSGLPARPTAGRSARRDRPQRRAKARSSRWRPTTRCWSPTRA